tara:strand:+ start:964 stop:2004 length:1041 start_codon:yes stop_codon:yes gene_type:complete
MENKIFNTKYTNVEYKVNHINEIPNPEKEIYRKKVIDNINDKYKIKIGDIFLNGYITNLNTDDPVLCSKIYKKDMNDDTKRNSILNEIKEHIRNIKNIEDKDYYVVKKVTKGNIELKYKRQIQKLKKKTYNRIIKQNIIKSDYDIDLVIWCLLYRYKALGYWGGMFGSIQPKYYNYFREVNNMEVEGFGSFLNHTLDYYFGLFYDLEKYFGCLGNFYNATFKKGIFLINPPYIIKHINKAIENCVDNLDKEKVSFVFSLPVWDVSTIKKLNDVCNNQKKIDFVTDIKVSKLRNNRYIKFNKIYCKEDFKYYDYLTEKYINYANTNILFLSSESKRYKFDVLPEPSI